VGRTLVHLYRSVDIAEFQIEVTGFVVESKLFINLGRTLQTVDDLEQRRDRLCRLVLDLELTGLFLEPVDVQGLPRRISQVAQIAELRRDKEFTEPSRG
jgi:hypothetical protein